MLESSEAPVVLTQERLVDALPPGGFEVVCLDRDWPEIAAASDCRRHRATATRSSSRT